MDENWVWRRFGTAHEQPCVDPTTITCARSACQLANRCQKSCNCPTVSHIQANGIVLFSTRHDTACLAQIFKDKRV